MNKLQSRFLVIVISVFLAAAIPSSVFAGGCYTDDQCGKNGIVCYPAGSPENAFCEATEPGTRAGTAPLIQPENVELCLGVSGAIPLDECRASIASVDVVDYDDNNTDTILSDIVAVGVFLVIFVGTILLLKQKKQF